MTLSVVFTSVRYHTGLGQFFGLQSFVNTSAGEVVEFHLLVVPMGWNWAVWIVQQMLEHLEPDGAGETTLRNLSPSPHWDESPVVKLLYIVNFAAFAGLSQVEAAESLTRMLGRLEAAGVVARAEFSSDAAGF